MHLEARRDGKMVSGKALFPHTHSLIPKKEATETPKEETKAQNEYWKSSETNETTIGESVAAS